MRRLFFSLFLLLSALSVKAQYNMQVWKDGKYVSFSIANVDSIRFVRLVTDIYLSEDKVELKEGETKQLTASVFPVDASDKGLMWSSSNPSVASVDASGLVKAVSVGTSLITVAATDGSGVKAECQITVTKAGGGDTGLLACPDDNHPHAIDLGLPSGTKWACCNVGASKPEGYGGYYAWGETNEKSYYAPSTYKYAVLDDNNGYWYDGHWYRCANIGSDITGTSYDVARTRMGAPWRMPSVEQMKELINNCSRQWTQHKGVNGIIVTGPSGGQVFLPAAGVRQYDELYWSDYGEYWSSSLYPDYAKYAYYLGFKSDYSGWNNGGSRWAGQSVRAVCP